MVSRRLFQALGLALGFVLVDYGFNLIASGLPGARAFTSEFLAANLLVGGSALVFVSLYFLLKPITTTSATAPQPISARPDIGIETIVEESSPPKPGFYKTIEYIGYFFALLGLVSAADLVLQVFLRSIYNEARWWVEVLLVTFGILSYTIFGSIGRLGAQEETSLKKLPATPETSPQNIVSTTETTPTTSPSIRAVTMTTEPMELKLAEFKSTATGEYERHIIGDSFDMFRVDREVVTVWREDRKGIRSNYLAGPYELTSKMLEEYAGRGQELRIGPLIISADTIRAILALQGKGPAQPTPAQANV
jgi:hypothetical protein